MLHRSPLGLRTREVGRQQTASSNAQQPPCPRLGVIGCSASPVSAIDIPPDPPDERENSASTSHRSASRFLDTLDGSVRPIASKIRDVLQSSLLSNSTRRASSKTSEPSLVDPDG